MQMKKCEHVHLVEEHFDAHPGAAMPSELKSHLGKCPVCNAYNENLHSYKAMMSGMNAEIEAPERLKKLARAIAGGEAAALPAVGRKAPGFIPPRRMAAAAAVLLVFGAVFAYWNFFIRQGCEGSFFADYNKFLVMADKYGVRTDDYEALSDWFTDRLDYRVTPPKAYGVVLTGGRRCHLLDRNLAVLFYEKEGHLVSIFILRGDDLDWKFAREKTESGKTIIADSDNGNNLIAWNENQLTYVAVADLSNDELKRLFFR